MKIFISWSGPRSKEMSVILSKWLPLIFPHLKFFISSEITKGSNFLEVILNELNEASMGIFLLTKGNTKSQWIQFEAGAFASKGISSRICPIWLDDDLEIDETGPLRYYQGSLVNEKDIFQLLESVNTSLDSPLEREVLVRLFNSNKNEFFYNWDLIKNIPTADPMGVKTNRELLLFLYKNLHGSRITIDRIYRDTGVLLNKLGEKLDFTPPGRTGVQPAPVVRMDMKPCYFSDDVTKVSGMAHYSGHFPYGGEFTSNEAWEIAVGNKTYEYKSLNE